MNKDFIELCKDERVLERFKDKEPNYRYKTFGNVTTCDYPANYCYCPTLSDLWQWWMELVGEELCDGKWKRSLAHLYNTTDILLKDCDTIEHALLACIVERLEKNNKCKQCGYALANNADYQGYCYQCACDKGLEQNPFDKGNTY